MRIQSKILLSFAIALVITSAASAQGRRMPWTEDEVDAAISLQVAGQSYHLQGKAECQHEPAAYIYSVPSEMWIVHQNDGRRSVSLSLWRPRSASGDMFSLSVGTRGKSYLVNTIKPGGAVKGSGKMTVIRSGAGGTFTINAALTGSVNGQVVNKLTVSGTALDYGQSGFEFTLGNAPVASNKLLTLQLLDQSGNPQASDVLIITYNDCKKNLILVRFKKSN